MRLCISSAKLDSWCIAQPLVVDNTNCANPFISLYFWFHVAAFANCEKANINENKPFLDVVNWLLPYWQCCGFASLFEHPDPASHFNSDPDPALKCSKVVFFYVQNDKTLWTGTNYRYRCASKYSIFDLFWKAAKPSRFFPQTDTFVGGSQQRGSGFIESISGPFF